MFSSSYQSGSQGVEILTPSGTGKDQKFAKFQGGVSRCYERNIKGYCYSLVKSGVATSIQCPASTRESLGIIQPLLFFQLRCDDIANLSIEVTVSDQKGLRHRLHFSGACRSLEANELHAQIPWTWAAADFPANQWMNLLIDLRLFTALCFHGATFANLDGFCIKPALMVRKVFTLPAPAPASASALAEEATQYHLTDSGELTFSLPLAMDFPKGVEHTLRVAAAPSASASVSASESVLTNPKIQSQLRTGDNLKSVSSAFNVRGTAFGTSVQRGLIPQTSSAEKAAKREKAVVTAAAGPLGGSSLYEALPPSPPSAPPSRAGTGGGRSDTHMKSAPTPPTPTASAKNENKSPQARARLSKAKSPAASKTPPAPKAPAQGPSSAKDASRGGNAHFSLKDSELPLPPRSNRGIIRYAVSEEQETSDFDGAAGTERRQGALLGVFERAPAGPTELATSMQSESADAEEGPAEMVMSVFTMPSIGTPKTFEQETALRIDNLMQRIQQASLGLSATEQEFAAEFGADFPVEEDLDNHNHNLWETEQDAVGSCCAEGEGEAEEA